MKAIQSSDLLAIEATLEEDVAWRALKQFVLAQLETNLLPNLFYHGIHHTRDDVLPASAQLAALTHIDAESRLVLLTSALLHDVGFMVGFEEHEQHGVRFVREWLPRFGFSDRRIEEVVRIILGTRMPQRPADLLEALLCDADLDSLGRPDYLATSINLWLELGVYGHPLTLESWYTRQLRFLSGHTYFTQAATQLRQAGQLENIRLLERLVSQNGNRAP